MNALDLLSGLVLDDGRTWGQACEPFQMEDAKAILSDDPPAYHFLSRSRGGSKTTDLAGVAIALLLTLPPRSRLYTLAADSDQGALALDAIEGFLARTPSLAGELEVKARSVVATATGSTLEVLAADAAGSWGLRPDAVIVDEIAAWGETSGPRKLWDAVATAVAKRPDARLVTLTTAGDPAHWSFRVRNHALDDPLWRVHEVRGPAPWLDPERVAEQRRRLTESMYRRLFENEWVEAEDRLSTVADIRACATLDGPLPPVEGNQYVLGLDIGLKRDRTSAIICHGEHFPDAEAGCRIVVDRHAIWEGSRRRPVRLSEIEDYIEQASREYRCEVVADPWQAVGLLQRLEGKGVRCREYPFTVAAVSRLASTLFQLLRDGALSLPTDEEFLAELEAVKIIERSPGVMRLDHASGKHDDRAVSLALAAQSILRQWSGDQRSYEIPLPPGGDDDWAFDRETESWIPLPEERGGIRRELIFRARATTTSTVIESNLDGLETK